MSETKPDDPERFQRLKDRMRTTWMTGDFGQVARYNEKCASEFIARLKPGPQMHVLDVACGTGNLAIPAARTGAHVWGIDIATNLIEQARKRAKAESLHVDFAEGDAEQLKFADAEFDLVMTMFGAMFAPRPQLVASELARVTKPGGRIAMANWTPTGFVGKMFALGNKHVPPAPDLPAPVEWGDEKKVRQRLGPYASAMRCTIQIANFELPFPPRDVVAFFREYFGPTQVAFSRLDTAGQAVYAKELEQLWSDHNLAGGDRTFVPCEFLEVVATRA
jgi:SAM-dependent methyltransferase